ncbi:MAG TPA: ribonuclease HI family protein [Ignavibacteria bacterium]|nr:ribonuclease HI family protein [Ignavibacteria bacterium]HMR40693.1 ribonuclease HI family protein [Ignavibacteria bacterium]
MGNKIRIFTDGASRGNPGKAATGVVVTDESGNELLTHKNFLGVMTNNSAEYTALIESVKVIKRSDLEYDEIEFYCDSELVVKQIRGLYKIKHKDLIKLSLEFWKEIKSLNKNFTIAHIPREQNKIADRLANEAIDEYVS